MAAKLSLVERIRGRRTKDIQLPNDTGKVDDRILAKREKSTANPLKRLGIGVQRLKQRAVKRPSSSRR
jgi:hypothetical protein